MRTYLASFDPARAGTSAAWTGSRALVFGGEGASGLLAQIARFDPALVSLTTASATLPTPRAGTVAFWSGAFAFVLGGEDAGGALDDVVRYDPVADVATLLPATLPAARSEASVAWDGTYAYVFGGRDGGTLLADVVRYHPASGAVATMGATLPTARWGTSAVWDGQYTYVFGGSDSSGSLAEVLRYDPVADAVTVRAAALPSAREATSAMFDGANAFVFGGVTGSSRHDQIVKYDPVADATLVMSAKLNTPRFGTSAVWNGSNAIVFAGQTGASSYSAQLLSYSLAPGAPQSLSASTGPGVGEISLAWSPPAANTYSTFTHYRVIRAPPGGSFTLHASVPSASTAFVDAGLSPGADWEYRVIAYDAVRGESPPSNVAGASAPDVPGAPQGFDAARGPGVGEISLSWSAPASNGGMAVDGYLVYRGASSTSLALHQTLGPVTGFVDAGLPDGATYFYQVSARNPVGEGPRSPVESASTMGPPSAPRNVAADGGPGAGEITLTWDAPADDGGASVTAYRVHRGTASGATSFLVELGDVRTFTDTGIPAGETRWYRVSAVNSFGEGARSAEASASAPVPPGAPESLQAQHGASLGEIDLTWQPPDDDGGAALLGYVIHRGEASGSEAPIAVIGPVTTFTDANRPLGTTWHYRVSAFNGAGEGALSNGASFVGTGVDLPEEAQAATRAVVIGLTPSPTALTPGARVRVTLVDNLGGPAPFPVANVTVGVFLLRDAARWAPAPGANLGAAAWSARVANADLAASGGAATFTYPGLGLGAAPALLWARYERPGGDWHEGFYAVGKTTLAAARLPAQGAFAHVATPVFAN